METEHADGQAQEYADGLSAIGVEDAEEESTALPEPAEPPVMVVQAYRSSYNETIAPPKGPLSRVVRPPIDFPPESKRAQTIELAEDDLEQDMDELKDAVHAYNVDFQRRIDEVKQRGRDLDAQIALENQEMELSAQQLHDRVRKQFQAAFLAMEQKTLSHFARLEVNEVATEERKTRECDASFRKFAYTTVPEIMERLQGSITRKLEKNHETFDIENAKIQKRERKTLNALESNEKRTALNFRTERERRHLKFQERDEQWHHTMKLDNRSSERTQSQHVATLTSLRQQLEAERQVRRKEDEVVLDTLATSFHRLQASILENLGEKTEH